MTTRSTLSNARSSKRDEFYTLYDDVKFELDHYLDQFKDKVIYCPCDTDNSAFVKYFLELEAKGLIKELLYTSIQNGTDFLSEGAIDGYRHSDIIVTNPPFSLFRPFLSLLDSINTSYIIWGTMNCISYKQVAKLLTRDKIRLGYTANKTCEFEVPSEYADDPNSKVYVVNSKCYIKVPSVAVYTNLQTNKSANLNLSKLFDSNLYSKYDNYDAINCNKTSDIPIDYSGCIGVPVTYLTKHDPSKYKIIGIFNNFIDDGDSDGCIFGDLVNLDKPPWKTRGPVVNGVPTYVRVIIKKI